MAVKLGNGGHSQENYDPETGKYISKEEASTNTEVGAETNTEVKTGNDNDNKKVSDISEKVGDKEAKANNVEDKSKTKNNDDDSPFGEEPEFKDGYDPKWDDIDLEEELEEDYANLTTKRELDEMFKKLDKELTYEEAAKSANPNYSKNRAYKTNCQRCIATFELRMRGYDVTTAPKTDKYDKWAYSDNYSTFFNCKGTDLKDLGATRLDNVYDNLSDVCKNAGEGSRFIIRGTRPFGAGHVFNCVCEKGEPVIYEAQTGEVYKGKEVIDAYFLFNSFQPTKLQILRVDDKEINDETIDYAIEGGKLEND